MVLSHADLLYAHSQAGWMAILSGRGQNIKPAGLIPGLISFCLVLEPGKLAIASF